MKLIALLSLCVAGSMANMGSVSVSYGMNTPPVVTYGAPSAPLAPLRYPAPAPMRAYASPAKYYSPPPPPPATPVQTYAPPPPATPVQSYAPPPATPVQSYAPPPAAPVQTYAPPPPATPVQSYAPPPATPIQSYAPPPATPVQTYAPPPPATPVQSYASAPAAYGSPAEESRVMIPITRYNHEMDEGKSHRVSFETGHGISHEEHTQIRMNPNAVPSAEDADAGKAMVTKTGSIAYTSPEGQRINLQYTSDENGFHPTGDHLPVPPTQPAEIVEATRQHQIAFDLAAKAAAAQQQQQGGDYGSSYGYAAPAPVARAPVAPFAALRNPY